MSEKKLSFGRAWLRVCLLVLVGASAGVYLQALRITGKPQTFISLAKLVAGGRMAGAYTKRGPPDYLQDFYGTIIETLESSEMRRRALDRVRALHPELKETEVKIQVSQNRGSAIFNVRAFGSDPKYTRIFLDALLDEFIAFRNQIREQQRNKALTTLAEDIVRREKDLQEKRAKLIAFRKANNIATLTASNDAATTRLKELIQSTEQVKERLDKLTQAGSDPAALAMLAMAPINASNSGPGQPPADSLTGKPLEDRLLAGERINLGVEYTNTRRTLRLLESEKAKLDQTSPGDSSSAQQYQEKIAEATATLRFLEDELREDANQTKQALADEVKALDAKIADIREDALKFGSQIAIHEELTKQEEDSWRAYDEMIDLIRRFTVNEDMATDTVTIMERALGAVEDIQEWVMPITVAGIGGGLAGLILSLILAAIIHAASPRKEPPPLPA